LLNSFAKVFMGAAGASGGNTVEYIGSDVAASSNGASVSVPLNAIGGGSPSTGDLMIVAFSCSGGEDERNNMSLSTSGFTDLASAHVFESNQLSTKVFHKAYAGESSIVSNAVVNVNTGSALDQTSVSLCVSVFRSVENISVFANRALRNTDDATWTEVTSLSAGNCVALFASTSHTNGFKYYSNPGDLDLWGDDVTTVYENDNHNITSGTGAKAITTESSFSPSTWNCNGSQNQSGVTAITVVLS